LRQTRLFYAFALTAILAAAGTAFSQDGGGDEEVIDLGEEIIELGEDEPVVPDAPVISGDKNAVSNDKNAEEPIDLELDENAIEIVDDEGGLEKTPELTGFVEARYPEELIKSGVEGSVLLELLVSETGSVDSVSVVRPLHPTLDACAVEAARKFKFSPATIAGGEAVAVMLQYEYLFTLKEVVTMPESYVNFSGRALERGTRRPIPDALVVLEFPDTLADTTLPMPFSLYMEQIGHIDGQSWEDSRLITATDSSGSFRFYSLPSMKVKMKIPLPDYELFVSEERINKLEETNITCYIARLDYADYELVVYGKVEEKEVSRRQISVAEVKRIPGLGGSAAKVVQAMPGVARPAFGGTDVVVRGAPGWATRYYLDGVSVRGLYHMGGIDAIHPSEVVEAVDFYPGGWGTRYGGATGGVVEMRTRAPKTDRLHGYIDLSMLHGGLFAEGPVNEKISFMASARRNFAGDILSLYFKLSDPKHTSISMAPFYWDYFFKVNVELNKNHRLFVSMTGDSDSLGIFIPSMNSGSTEIDGALDEMNMSTAYHSLIIGLDSRLNDKWKNSLRLSGALANFRMSVFGYAQMEEKDRIGSLRNQITYRANDNVTVNAGADIDLAGVGIDMTIVAGSNVIVPVEIEGTYGTVGGYVNVEWKPTDKLLLVPGLRYDWFPELDYSGSLVPPFWDYGIIDNRRGASGEPAFRLSGRYELTEGHTAKAAVGTYSQSPEPLGMSIHEVSGNPDLPATKATHYVAGYEWQISDLLGLDAQTYFNNMWDVARSYDSRTDYDPAREIQRRYFSDGRDRTYGLELMLRHQRSEKFFGWVSYTLSRSETYSKFEGKYILSSRDEPHHLQLLGSWRFKNDLDFGVRTRLVSGKPTSPIIGTIENESNKGISPVYGERNSTRQDPFFQVDLRLDKKVIYTKWILTYYVDMQNVLWPIYRSPELTYYNYNYTEKQKISMIPMVSMGVKAEF